MYFTILAMINLNITWNNSIEDISKMSNILFITHKNVKEKYKSYKKYINIKQIIIKKTMNINY